MVADAERNRSDDIRLRQEVDARNELDAVAYQVEKRLAELGESVPVHEKARAEQLVADARAAMKDGAPVDRLRSLSGELQQIYQSLVAARTGAGNGYGDGDGQGDGSGGGPERAGADDDDVIDAEFTTG
jgi:molecular chaperone DnaK